MDKLKKLGKYFTKGLQAGVLATALIAGNVSCSNAAGGDSADDTFVTPPTPPIPPKGDESTWPDYYINTEFGGQRFTELTAKLSADNNRDASFNNYYTNAKKFMDAKVNELADLANQSDIGSFYSEIQTLLQNYSKADTIKTNIEKNYTALAPIFKAMRNNLGSTQDRDCFSVSYYKLAADAFNQSLGDYSHGTSPQDFETNKEMVDDYNTFRSEWQDAGLNSYADATDRKKAVDRMNNYLNTIHNNTYVDTAVLKKVVELALYNESLYGLNDQAVKAGVNVYSQDLNSTERSFLNFRNKISNVTYSLANTQNLDDRTM